MEDKAISPTESLQIIEKMLADTRNRFYNNGFAFLFWGLLIIIICLTSFATHALGHEGRDGWIWGIGISVGIIATAMYFWKIAPKTRKFTRLDAINGKVWIGYAISYFVLMFLCAHYHLFAPPFIYLLLGMGMFITGGIYKFWSLYAGAIIFWLGAVISALLPMNNSQLLLTSLLMFLGYLLPGYILWKKAKGEAHV
ncbi:hypothetical protein SAMN05192529_111126 [Arachidicoccus rhizosphaerae]|jgi:hypothetical protein|uniref:Uncharacterized protein n=1 Tax=Arachidicoccus rhizosphaerae TaxID=551991 RepID=A0A1H3ZMA1_9BACT|nr:hypothetical protein [Arachidicoccus rhizosphaerae]SEA24926.1 hypothetical protein SAMN05192529_111126 [Arachidicoccus rhizosphaerae]